MALRGAIPLKLSPLLSGAIPATTAAAGHYSFQV
jgi:hypothetical protein